MRSISSIIIKALSLLLILSLLMPAAQATTMDDNLTLAMVSVKTQYLNPLVSQEREFQSLTALMYEGLYSLNDDYVPEYCLAKRVDCSSDGKTWTVTMREDIYFHDGSPCTAYDVEATIHEILRLANENQGQYAQLKYFIKSVKAQKATELVIEASRSYMGLEYALTFPVLPKNQVNAMNPLGTGPYKQDHFVPGNYLYLSAFEKWHEPTPFVKEINVLFKETNREVITEYEFNRVDAAITRSASAGQYQTSLTNLNITYRTRQLETLQLNRSAFPLEDVNIRKAIRYAIDLDGICNLIYMGMAQRTDTPLPSGTWMYRDNDSAHVYNPEKARQLLKEAGWSYLDDDEILDKVVGDAVKHLQLRIHVYEEQDNSVRVQVAHMISDDLKAVGINAPVHTESFASIAERLQNRNYDMCIAAFQMDVAPDPGFLLMSANTGNYTGYRSSQMDKLFKELRTATDQSTYQNLLYQIQDLFIEDCPFICMYYRNGALLTRKVFTTVRDVREPEILRGIESVGL